MEVRGQLWGVIPSFYLGSSVGTRVPGIVSLSHPAGPVFFQDRSRGAVRTVVDGGTGNTKVWEGVAPSGQGDTPVTIWIRVWSRSSVTVGVVVTELFHGSFRTKQKEAVTE